MNLARSSGVYSGESAAGFNEESSNAFSAAPNPDTERVIYWLIEARRWSGENCETLRG